MTDSDSTYGEEGSGSPTESKPNWRRDLENRAKEAEQQAADYASRLEILSVGTHFDQQVTLTMLVQDTLLKRMTVKWTRMLSVQKRKRQDSLDQMLQQLVPPIRKMPLQRNRE